MSKPAWLDRLLTWGSFPTIFGGAVAVGLLGFARGWPRGLLVATTVGVAGALIVALERIHPHEPRWLRSHGDVGTDLLHGLVTMLALPELLRAAFFGALYVASSRLSDAVGFGLWPTGWPLLVQVALALVVTELPYYWWHRLQHESDLLWRFHAVHHSAPRLYWLNAARFHPVDTLGGYVMQAPVLILLGAPDAVLGMFLIVTGVHGLFQHANLRVRLGPLNWVFSMAELHRWHHSRTLEEANHNYGGNLILWDLVFGTRFAPAGREPPRDIGIADLPAFPRGYLAQLASPFRWTRVRATAGAEGSADPRPIGHGIPTDRTL
ncbi:MAG TPA: sterol desaturase family protein [Sandaracinaceae bacterium LLY-WYZ-13_1]|nr:sterol desaturase family protein [Sandaracinaceae bacterium LLY-WYZ-13_1]